MGAFEGNNGKVSVQIFKEDLEHSCGATRPEILQGPAFGVDTALIDLGGGNALAVSSDPLSIIPSLGMEVSAWLSVHLLANDMCTTGFPPQYAQFVLNLPEALSRTDFNTYWQCMHHLCKQHDIAITGGHTGQIPGINATIAGGGTMFLTAPKNQLLSSSGAKAGDRIIMTKSAALSSTALLARAFPQTVRKKLGDSLWQKAAQNFWKLSVLPESAMAMQTLSPGQTLHAMHDVTEGGILGAVAEMATASKFGFQVDKNAIPVEDEVRQVADLFQIDPLLSIGAGSMLMAVAPESESQLISALGEADIPATSIGTFTKNTDQTVIENGQTKPFHFDGTDPYWAAFYNAISRGWQ